MRSKKFSSSYKVAGKINFTVTGGAGLIGSWVVDSLINEYADKIGEITILDNFSRGTMDNLLGALQNKNVKLVKGDIRDPETVDRVIAGADYVIHEAAIRITQCAEEPRLCNDVLVNGTFNVFDSCVRHKVNKLVFNSSASVYGNPTYVPMDEKHPYNNDTAYGAAKIANESMARAFRAMYGLKYVCLRPFNVYGPRMDIHGVYTEVLIRWLDRIDKGMPPIIHGNGEQSLDFIYVGDVARATMCALRSHINEGVYNVGSGRETDLNQLAKLLLKLMKSNLSLVYEPQRRVASVKRRKADIQWAKKDLGFVASTSLEEGLKRLIEWRRKKERPKYVSTAHLTKI